MLNHFSITVTNLVEVGRFYDAITEALGIPRIGQTDDQISYGLRADADHPDGEYFTIKLVDSVTAEYRRHWCFTAANRDVVDRFWRAGVAAGGTDQGRPGIRHEYHPSYYAAFIADPDGNRLEAVHHR